MSILIRNLVGEYEHQSLKGRPISIVERWVMHQIWYGVMMIERQHSNDSATDGKADWYMSRHPPMSIVGHPLWGQRSKNEKEKKEEDDWSTLNLPGFDACVKIRNISSGMGDGETGVWQKNKRAPEFEESGEVCTSRVKVTRGKCWKIECKLKWTCWQKVEKHSQ